MKKKVLLMVLDGYGEGKDYKWNAVTRSNTPFLDQLRANYPITFLQADSEHVGLPCNIMGNSEVGHFTMGCGRIVFQSLELINQSIKSGEFFKMKFLKKAAENCRKKDSKFHILGMISDAGVHSHLDHCYALLKFAKREKLNKIFIHGITDGRDVPERCADKYIKAINKKIKELGLEKKAKLASLVGRFYAMDRDTNYNRTQKAYDLYTLGKGKEEKNGVSGIKNNYKKGIKTDYYIEPIILDKDGIMTDEDSVVFFNYRTDRAKQITEVLTEKSCSKMPRKKIIRPEFVCFGPYSKIAPVLFEADLVKNNLSEMLSKKGVKQIRIAETEKYPHISFFFNSQIKKPWKGEKHIIVPSPKVRSYDLQPEMNCAAVTKECLKALAADKHEFIMINFANTDLVAHSGNWEATLKAIESVDSSVQKIVPKALEKGFTIMLTADHGNCELMRYPNGKPCPSHTTNPVPLIYISPEGKRIKLRQGKTLGLKDVAPTILNTLGIKAPKEMTGKSLIN